jgi:hypothetical protein
MSNAAIAITPRYRYDDTAPRSRSARRILRRSASSPCPSGKQTYRTARKARIALATLQREELRRQTVLGQEARVEREPYVCRDCGMHHLTSQEG